MGLGVVQIPRPVSESPQKRESGTAEGVLPAPKGGAVLFADVDGHFPPLIKGHFRLPDFPYFSHQVGSRFQGDLSRFPAGRCGFCALAVSYELKSLNLAKSLGHIASHRGRKHLVSLDHPIRIDNEPSPGLYTRVFVKDTVDSPHLAPVSDNMGKGTPPSTILESS